MGAGQGSRPGKFYDRGVERAALYLLKTAWLASIPSGALGKAGLTRRQLIGNDEADRQTPDVGPMSYLVDALIEAGSGVVMPQVKGPFYQPLPWSELINWPRAPDFLPCEIQSIRDLSTIYATMLNSGPQAQDPWQVLDDAELHP